MKGKYLYGIIKKPEDTRRWRKKDGVSTVDYRSLSAVVAETEVKDYHTLPKEETVQELIRHQQMIEKIMSESPILPVKFGTILEDEEKVTCALEKGYFFLQNALRKIEDKIELDLVCFWNEQKAARMAFRESRKVKNFYKKITGGAVEEKIALGKLVADYLASKKEKISLQILEALKKETVERCSHALADVNMLLNQAYLVENKKQESFTRTLNILNSKFKDLLNFRLVGPLPPYSFTTLVIESLDEKEVEKARKTFKLNGELSMKKLKQTYDTLVMKLHPDKGGNPLEFELTTSAYTLLKNFIENGLVTFSLYKWEER